MTNPVLDSTAPYVGMSTNEMMEEILRRRGLTLDSDSTGRVEASTAEQADILRYMKRAHSLFNAEFQETFSLGRVSGTWTEGDTAIMLPAGASALLSFYLNGSLCLPIEMEDLRRATYEDQFVTDAMGFQYNQSVSGQLFWRFSGVADADAVANGGAGTTPDWRVVLQLYGVNPQDDINAVPYVMDYVRYGENFIASESAVRLHPVVQEWLVLKAASMWASAENDDTTKTLAMMEMMELEQPLWAVFDSRGDTAQRARWTYPVLAKATRRSK